MIDCGFRQNPFSENQIHSKVFLFHNEDKFWWVHYHYSRGTE